MKTAVLWYYKESKDCLFEIQIFDNQELAREFLQNAEKIDDAICRVVPNIKVFMQDKNKNLILQ
jgi:hypothetical protein